MSGGARDEDCYLPFKYVEDMDMPLGTSRCKHTKSQEICAHNSFMCVCGGGALLNLLQYCFYFMFWFFGGKVYGFSSPTRDWIPTPCIGRQVLTIRPPEKSLCLRFLILVCIFHSGKSPVKSKTRLMLLKDSWSHDIYIYIYTHIHTYYMCY